MRRQLQGIALLLFAILLMLGYGGCWLLDDIGVRWREVFALLGAAGLVWALWPERKKP